MAAAAAEVVVVGGEAMQLGASAWLATPTAARPAVQCMAAHKRPARQTYNRSSCNEHCAGRWDVQNQRGLSGCCVRAGQRQRGFTPAVGSARLRICAEPRGDGDRSVWSRLLKSKPNSLVRQIFGAMAAESDNVLRECRLAFQGGAGSRAARCRNRRVPGTSPARGCKHLKTTMHAPPFAPSPPCTVKVGVCRS